MNVIGKVDSSVGPTNLGAWRRLCSPAVVFLIGIMLCVAVAPLALKARVQLIVAPLFFLVFLRLSFFRCSVPKLVVTVPLLGCLAGAIVQFSHVGLARGAFLVSTVSDSDLGQQTKIYRDRLRRSVGSHGDAFVGTHAGEISDERSARIPLATNRNLAGVIWGSPRWMSVGLRQYPPLELSSFPGHSAGAQFLVSRRIPELLIARSIPVVGMSHGHERGTVHFLSVLIKTWHQIPHMLSVGGSSGGFEGEFESLARTQARWTSRAHLALPLWLVGTTLLVRATEGSAVQAAELRCALERFREALSLFRTHDNPALEMAVRNNYGIALLMHSEYLGSPRKHRKKAIRHLAAASKLRKLNAEVGAVVAHNYLALVGPKKRRAKNARR